MSLLRNITSGLRSLFQKEQVDRELDEEQASVGKRIWPFLKLYWQKKRRRIASLAFDLVGSLVIQAV